MVTDYVLIDYENVQPDLLPLLDHKQMRVIVFVGACKKSVPFEFAAAMQRLGRRATYVKLSGNGSNALDFHIAFYLGVLAVRDSAAYFHIISKDTGYDPLIQHLRARDIKAHRFEDVRDIPTIKKDLSSPLPPAPAPEPRCLPAAGAPSVPQPEPNEHSAAAGAPKTGAHATNGVAPPLNGVHAAAMPNGTAVKAVNGNGVHASSGTIAVLAIAGDNQGCVRDGSTGAPSRHCLRPGQQQRTTQMRQQELHHLPMPALPHNFHQTNGSTLFSCTSRNRAPPDLAK
ncbi:PIN domain-containing protein [Roseiflexus castenholzii]|uniref:PIN-like domain-containing protein n=1 Tax=Roseiflexus castenholzii (strain DSM 13941 / HLO8) TaxID=383372 RepID=A7NH68_ROSCS|nr:PIN domain-containing protein [Roseiflexus castenholzii]ABU56815.1 hypothetical protein Rcas_0693 [Roseiflexus castenholzii DSM 13941]